MDLSRKFCAWKSKRILGSRRPMNGGLSDLFRRRPRRGADARAAPRAAAKRWRMSMDERKYLTSAEQFGDVSRGNPKPFTLQGEDLNRARLTPETWRLEIVSDGSTQIEKPRTIADNTAIDFAM